MSKADKLKKKAAEFEAKRQTDKAIAAYLDLFREWEANPTGDVDVALYNRVGDMLLKAGNVGDAMTVWETAVDHYADSGLHNNAIALCNKILRNSPGRAMVYYKLGKISAQKGFRGEARKNYLEYADRMQKSGNIDEAFRALNEFADLTPEDNDIRNTLAEQLLKIGRKEEAIEQLQVLHERHESNGDAAAAKATLERMRAIDPAVEPKRSGPRGPANVGGLVFINVDDDPPTPRKHPTPAPEPPPPPKKKSAPLPKFASDQRTRTATDGLPLIDLNDEPPEPVEPPPVVEEPEPTIPEPMLVIPPPVEEPTPEPVGESVPEPMPEEIPEPAAELTTVEQVVAAEASATESIVDDLVPTMPDLVPTAIEEEQPSNREPVLTPMEDVIPTIPEEPAVEVESLPSILEETPPPEEVEELPSLLEETVGEQTQEPVNLAEALVAENQGAVEEEQAAVEEEFVIDEEPAVEEPAVEEPVAVEEQPVAAEFAVGDEAIASEEPAAVEDEVVVEAATSSDETWIAETPEFEEPEVAGPEPEVEEVAEVAELGDSQEIAAVAEAEEEAIADVEEEKVADVEEEPVAHVEEETFEEPEEAVAELEAVDADEDAVEPEEVVAEETEEEFVAAAETPASVTPVSAEVVPEEPVAPPPPPTVADAPMIMPEISFGASFGTDEAAPPGTPPVEEVVANPFDPSPHMGARVSASLSSPEDLTFGTADVEPFTSRAGDPNALVDEPIEFGQSSALAGDGIDPTLVFDGAAVGFESFFNAPPQGEITEEEAPAPREAIRRKSMRPTMSALAMSVDSLRERVRGDVTNWPLRRQFAEALLEDGDREGGLEELENAMVGFERATDYEQARSVAEEIIRLEPLSVRHHQKRVEFSYRLNERPRLIDAYLDLADALFQGGETEKSKVVYERVLDLAPDDVRAQAAMSAFASAEEAAAPAAADAGEPEPFLTDADLMDDPQEEQPRPSIETAVDENFRASILTPPQPAKAVGEEKEKERERPFADTFKPRITPYVVEPVARVSGSTPVVPEPPPPKKKESGGDFVDLEDWLKEEDAPKSTRMRIQDHTPTGDEQADFNDMLRKFKQGVAKNVEDEDHESHYDLGVAFKEMGLIEEAIAEFQKALRSPTHRVRTYEALGQCFIEKSQEQVAMTILQRALNEPGAADDKLIGVLYLLGVSAEALDQPREAVKYYQRVFAVDINFRDVRKRMREIDKAAR